jgi:CHAD domain-containing protein
MSRRRADPNVSTAFMTCGLRYAGSGAIRDFGEITDKFPLRNLRKRLKRLADSLGVVLDADVCIGTLEKLSEQSRDESIRAGIESIASEYRETRAAGHEELKKELASERIADLESRFDAARRIAQAAGSIRLAGRTRPRT